MMRIKNYCMSLSHIRDSRSQITFQIKTYYNLIFALIFILTCDTSWLMCQGSLHYPNLYSFNNVFESSGS